MSEKEQVRLQIFVSKEVADQLDKLAANVGASRNQVAGWLLEWGTSADEGLMNRFGSWVAGLFVRAMRKASGVEGGGS